MDDSGLALWQTQRLGMISHHNESEDGDYLSGVVCAPAMTEICGEMGDCFDVKVDDCTAGALSCGSLDEIGFISVWQSVVH